MDAAQALAEAQALLAQQVWNIRDRIFLEGEHVCILFDPYPAAEMAHFNVPATIFLPQAVPAPQPDSARARNLTALSTTVVSSSWTGSFSNLPPALIRRVDRRSAHFQESLTGFRTGPRSLQASSVPFG